MKDWQARVVQELKELTVKGEAITEFIYESDKYETLDRVEKIDLAMQFGHMTGYAAALTDRISRFEN